MQGSFPCLLACLLACLCHEPDFVVTEASLYFPGLSSDYNSKRRLKCVFHVPFGLSGSISVSFVLHGFLLRVFYKKLP